jgi:hypothetical protein
LQFSGAIPFFRRPRGTEATAGATSGAHAIAPIFKPHPKSLKSL